MIAQYAIGYNYDTKKLKLLDLQLICTFAASLWPLFNYINQFLLYKEEE